MRRPHRLLVLRPRPQNRARVDVKHLHLARVVARNQHLAVAPNVAAARHVAEACNGFEQLTRARRVDLHARAGGHGKGVAAAAAGNVCHRVVRRRGQQQLVLKGTPVALLGRDGRGARGELELRQGFDLRRHGDVFLGISIVLVWEIVRRLDQS